MTHKLLDISGIGKDRLHLYWCSSAEAQRFAEIAAKVTASIRDQGKFDPSAHAAQLDAAEAALSGETLRWMVGKEVKITTKGDVYGRQWDEKSYQSILDSVLEREYQVQLIIGAIKTGHTAPREIGDQVGLDPGRVSYLLADMEKRSIVEFKGMEAYQPVFAAL